MNWKKLLYLIICKPIGKFWIFVAIPFRGYARSVVYNYVLQHDLPLKRLRERKPKWVSPESLLEDVHYLSHFSPGIKGKIYGRSVSALEFYLVVFLLWSWLDDDANHDTTDLGYIGTLLDGSRKSWHRVFIPWLKKIDAKEAVYGNSFDLGDTRERYPFFNWAATFVWNDRNTAMNFQYLFFDY